MPFRRPAALLCAAAVLALALAPAGQGAPPGAVNQAKDGWPPITGMLLINRNDASRTLDARPGRDPFGGQDPRYSCDGERSPRNCEHRFVPCEIGHGRCVTHLPGNNELLGGHGNDRIYGGPWSDVIWGDYKPDAYRHRRQVDRLYGGPGRDFIYGSHGRNIIKAGRGNDFVKARYGRGVVDCGPGRDVLYTSRRFRKNYRIRNCERVTVGPSPATRARLRGELMTP